LKEQTNKKQQTLRTLQQEAFRYEEQLASLLAQIKSRVLELDEPDLTRLLELAGL